MATKDLDKQLHYIYGLERFGIRLGLEVMTKLLAALGNPHQQLRSIHITGTNGKGSTAAFIESVLRESGLKVGLYTSPHLYRFNERVRISGQEINNKELLKLITEVKAATHAHHLQATFFEFTTALAFLYFARQKIDIAVVEVGMGGELDATNVITPLIAIITNIGLDHVPIIGKNKMGIARNKAGIIKTGCDVVTAEKNKIILTYFADVCRQRQANLYPVQKHMVVHQISASLDKQIFEARGRPEGKYTISLLGKHQLTNAASALLAVSLLRDHHGFSITNEHIQAGLAKTQWEGRLEIVSRQPFVLVDGAHNNDGVRSLVTFLKEMSLPRPEVLILAVKKGKNTREFMTKVIPLFEHVIVTEGSYEPAKAEIIAKEIKNIHPHVEAIPNVQEAVAMAKKLLTSEGMMLVTGSLYMIGDALAILRRK
jgi:dihydrofolate synthase/folylpolyglutamate synthase